MSAKVTHERMMCCSWPGIIWKSKGHLKIDPIILWYVMARCQTGYICRYLLQSHDETFSVLLAICAGNSPVTGEFPTQRPVTWDFDVFFDLCLNKRLSKQLWDWWFETPSSPLRCHCNKGIIFGARRQCAEISVWLFLTRKCSPWIDNFASVLNYVKSNQPLQLIFFIVDIAYKQNINYLWGISEKKNGRVQASWFALLSTLLTNKT